MEAPTFEWDPQKATANLKTHGVSFDKAVTVFLRTLSASFTLIQITRRASPGRSSLGIPPEGPCFSCPSLIERVEFRARRATRHERREYEKSRQWVRMTPPTT